VIGSQIQAACFLPESFHQVLFGNVVPEAYTSEDVIQRALCEDLMVGDGEIVFADSGDLAESDVAATLTNGLVSQGVQVLDECAAANLR
jgi:hypothetical protein